MAPGKIVLGFSAMFALLIVFAVQRVPGDERIVVEKPKIRTGADDIVALPKTDREPIRAINLSIEPKTVTERMPPAPNAPVSVPPVILVQDDDDKPPAARHRRHRNSEPGHSHSERNVCTRHKMRKVITHGGRSWRCRK
jgi:hypothetical protein